MNTSGTDYRKSAIRVDDELLEELEDAFTSFVGETKWEIECVDGATREFSSLKALMAHDNRGSKQVKKLSLRGYDHPRNRTGALDIEIDYLLGHYRFNWEGEERYSIEFRNKVHRFLLNSKPWYSPVCIVGRFWTPVLLSLLFGYLIDSLATRYGWKSVLGGFTSYFALAANVVLALTISGLKERIFPPVDFVFGTGTKRHQFLENIRWVVVVGFVVSVVAGLATSFVWAWLST